jgi:hypothetical protein
LSLFSIGISWVLTRGSRHEEHFHHHGKVGISERWGFGPFVISVKQIPATQDLLVLRTDFSDDSAWRQVCEEIKQRVGDFQDYVECISDPAFDGLTSEQLVAALGSSLDRSFAFLVDQTTFAHPEQPILVVDLHGELGRTLRVIPSEAGAIENNLSIGNMDFEELADSVDDDGVFRGFP